MNQNTFYTDKEIRLLSDIAISAMIKYMAWEEQYNKEKEQNYISKIIKLQS